ncbi:MAG: SPOR domain-containing protein [Candidatus Thiodiazotropha sp. 6PLUC2]
MALEERLKQRMLGGAVLVALIVIFVPMLIEEPVEKRDQSAHSIPIKPQSPTSQPVRTPEPVKPQKKIASEAPPPKPAVEQKPKAQPKPKPVVKTKPKKAATSDKSRTSPTAWIIQVASLTNEKNAEKLVEKLRKADLPAQMELVKLDGKRHYRIRVGPEVDHRLAEKMLAKIKKDFKMNPKLMRYPQ